MIKYGPYLCKGHIYHTKFFLGKHLKIVNNSQILVSRSHRSMCHWAQPAQYRAYALIQLRACRRAPARISACQLPVWRDLSRRKKSRWGLFLCRCPVRGMSRRCSCIWPEAAAMSGSGYDAWRKITRCMQCCRRLKRRRSAEV